MPYSMVELVSIYVILTFPHVIPGLTRNLHTFLLIG